MLLHRQAALSHNLANASTPGIKQEIVLAHETPTRPLFQQGESVSAQAIGALSAGVDGTQMRIDYSQGPLESTGRSLDLAVTGDGFFRVQTPQGVRLTRDGTFHRDSAGTLVTAAGNALLGQNGPIHIGDGDPYITEDGSVFVPGANAPVEQIALGQVANLDALRTEGDNLIDPGNEPVTRMPAGETRIRQGFVEGANVDLSGAMVGMMLALRSYEAAQRSLQMQDETLRQTMDVGRLA